ncbi:hypothetical protein KUTeg_008096 [Tegillarca granosa]|uniref:Integrin beta n=1 Tax=Tegillarca granosa TaxID=220873 RepID=A0ABQ9F847_TEGGR|nr:hypothetical protein KUTeg_008096 [Tegillarca granosa]
MTTFLIRNKRLLTKGKLFIYYMENILILCISVLSSQFGTVYNLNRGYDCRSKITCGECLQTGPHCAFCVSQVYDENNQPRCDILHNHFGICPDGELVNPQGKWQKIKSKPALLVQDEPTKDFDSNGPAIQIQPQELKLTLRPNEPQRFSVTFRLADNYPIDLYYLMDFSYSMKDDKDNIARLGNQIGFQIHESVQNARISENLDSAEGGFDALLQAVTCQDQIGWRDYSRRLLLFSTDAEPHFAGDGKLGGIVKPNDGECHLDTDGNYTETVNQDYPSLSQLANAVKDNNINIIFAVPEKLVPYYRQISDFIPGSDTGQINDDSENVVQLIKHNYEQMKSEIFSCSSYKYQHIPHNTSQETNRCGDVKLGESVTFDVEIEFTECPDNTSLYERVIEFKTIGLQDKMIVNISLTCQCDCEKGEEPIKNSLKCSSQGTEVCGICDCNFGFYGPHCECNRINITDENQEMCIEQNTSSICSGRGECFCGVCHCFSRRNDPSTKYSGKWCQCDDYDCPFSNGVICGGSANGVCYCGKCSCTSAYTGDACDCPTSTETCMAKGNSPGECKEVCREYKDCVECTVHRTGVYDVEECKINCEYDLNITIVEQLPVKTKICQFKDQNDCVFHFSYEYGSSSDLHILALRKKDCNVYQEINAVAIAVGLISAIVIVAIILLIQGNPLYKEPQRQYVNPVFGK